MHFWIIENKKEHRLFSVGETKSGNEIGMNGLCLRELYSKLTGHHNVEFELDPFIIVECIWHKIILKLILHNISMIAPLNILICLIFPTFWTHFCANILRFCVPHQNLLWLFIPTKWFHFISRNSKLSEETGFR